MKPIRIAIVDDHRVVSRSLSAYFGLFSDLEIVGMCASGEELLTQAAVWGPDVVIMDLLLPGGIDGVETTARLLRACPAARVVALTASIDEHRMLAVLRAGAVGYVRKNSDPETLLAAVRAVATGKRYIDPEARSSVAFEETLSPRELDVLRQLARGLANKEIAEVLGVTEETVKSHVSRVLAKLEADNRADAIVQALRRGVLVLEELN